MALDGPALLTQHQRGVGEPSRPEAPEQMLQRALDDYLDAGRCDVQRLIDVAVAYREKWSSYADQVEAGERLDGRASIYTGETYAEAAQRWETYRALLVEHARGAMGALS